MENEMENEKEKNKSKMALEFTQCLLSAQSPDAKVRNDAQNILLQFQEQNLGEFLTFLSSELSNDWKPVETRILAGTVLKNSLEQLVQQQQWVDLDISSKSQIKGLLLYTLGSSVREARQTAAQVVARIASIEIPRKDWPELIGLLLANITRRNAPPYLKTSAFEILGHMFKEMSHVDLGHEEATAILRRVAQGMNMCKSDREVQHSATTALRHALLLSQTNFDKWERENIIKVFCDAAFAEEACDRQAAFECLVSIACIYYQVLEPYMLHKLEHTSTSDVYISPEVGEEILSHNSVRYILQIMSGSSWMKMVFSRYFELMHNKNTLKHLEDWDRKQVVFLSLSPSNSIVTCSLDELSRGGIDIGFREWEQNRGKPIRVVGCTSHGIVCVVVEGKRFLLWNPTTGRYMKIPFFNDVIHFYDYITVGFDFDVGLNEYRIVQILPGDVQGHHIVKVYSYQSNSWKNIPIFFDGIVIFGTGKLLNHKLHWGAWPRYDYYNWAIFTFDLITETCGLIEPPNLETDSRLTLAILEEVLCVVDGHQIWQRRLRDDGSYFWEGGLHVPVLPPQSQEELLSYLMPIIPLTFGPDQELLHFNESEFCAVDGGGERHFEVGKFRAIIDAQTTVDALISLGGDLDTRCTSFDLEGYSSDSDS